MPPFALGPGSQAGASQPRGTAKLGPPPGSSHGSAGASQPYGTAKLGPVGGAGLLQHFAAAVAAPAQAVAHATSQAAPPLPSAGPPASAHGLPVQGQVASEPGPSPQTRAALVQVLRNYFQTASSKGLLPKGAQFPNLVFDKAFQGAPAYTVGRDIHVTPEFVNIALRGTGMAGAWARQGLVHELAHTMQNAPAASEKALVEGGAQAFADRVGPSVIPNYRPSGDGNYTNFVQGMNVREPASWVMQNQFNPHVTNAPPINMPGNPDFANALRGLGGMANRSMSGVGEFLVNPNTVTDVAPPPPLARAGRRR